MADIFCYGEAMVLVAPTETATLAARPFCGLSPAGAEFNVASHLAGLSVIASRGPVRSVLTPSQRSSSRRPGSEG